MKIDVESAEYEILFTETCGSIRRFEFLIIEIHKHDRWTAQELIRRIESFGFEPVPVPNAEHADVYFFKRKTAA